MKPTKCYLAGRMSGKLNWGQKEFSDAEIYLIKQGFSVINPFGLHPEPTSTFEQEMYNPAAWDVKWAAYLRKDIPALLECDELRVTGPDWIESRGAKLEVFIAQSLFIPTKTLEGQRLPPISLPAGFSHIRKNAWVEALEKPQYTPLERLFSEPLPTYVVTTTGVEPETYPEGMGETVAKESILDEAKRITSGDRRHDYGHPSENFKRIADLWNAYLGVRKDPSAPVSPEDVAWMMVLLKIARDVNTPHRDSLVDSLGYVRCLSMMRGWEE